MSEKSLLLNNSGRQLPNIGFSGIDILKAVSGGYGGGPVDFASKTRETQTQPAAITPQMAPATMTDHSVRGVQLRQLAQLVQKGAQQRTSDLLNIPVQRKDLDEDKLQVKSTASTAVNGTDLPDSLKSGIESLSGMAMDHVQVHRNSSKPAQLNAHAYAQGSDIHLGPGKEAHLPHEAWHVVQQAQGRVKPTMQMKGGVQINDDEALEREADVMGARALSSQVDQNSSQRTGFSANSQASPAQLVRIYRTDFEGNKWKDIAWEFWERHGEWIDTDDWTVDDLREILRMLEDAGNMPVAEEIAGTIDTRIADQAAATGLIPSVASASDMGASADLAVDRDDQATTSRITDALPAAPILIPNPHLPGDMKPKKSGQEQEVELPEFSQNIRALHEKIAVLAPARNEEYDREIERQIAVEQNPEDGSDGDVLEAEAITLAYNHLPPDIAEYWKTRETHDSLLIGLRLILAKAEDPNGYPVSIEKFNAIFASLMGRDDAELLVAIQSLMSLAPNRHDLLEPMDQGEMRGTTGINCGKTIASGFNRALDALLPPQASTVIFCEAVNKQLLTQVMNRCLMLSGTMSELPENLRKALVARIILATVMNDGSIAELAAVFPAKVIRQMQQILFGIYTPDEIRSACRRELARLAGVIISPGEGAVEANAQLDAISRELSLTNLYALLGEEFVSTFDVGDVDVPNDLLDALALSGGLMTEAPAAVDPMASAAGGSESASDETEDQSTQFLNPGMLAETPPQLEDVIRLYPGTANGDNLYLDKGIFQSRWGLFDEAGNNNARDALHALLLERGLTILRTHMPFEEAWNMIKPLRQYFDRESPYTLANARADFEKLRLRIITSIEIYTSANNLLADLA